MKQCYGLKQMADRLLVVEDEKNLGLTLVSQLKLKGYEVSWAKSAEEAYLELTNKKHNLVLLDVGLPDQSGFEVAKYIRNHHRSVAVVFLTAMGSPEDRIRGLEIGAEDYMVKPFHLKELFLRIQNALKRTQYLLSISSAVSDIATIGQATIYFSRFEAVKDGAITPLTHKECALLKLLAERKGRAVSRDEILDQICQNDETLSLRTIDNFIMRLRRVVEKNPEKPEIIKSVRGVGYQLNEFI